MTTISEVSLCRDLIDEHVDQIRRPTEQTRKIYPHSRLLSLMTRWQISGAIWFTRIGLFAVLFWRYRQLYRQEPRRP